jgi:cyclopropane fatty-acyl-phospholipid synthase-like methyltransferase
MSDAQRRAFLDERRAVSRQRYDELHAPTYDETWGATCDPTHVAHVDRVIGALRPGDEVLDVGCGTGKYWPQLLVAGRRPFGVDQSARMLERARAKAPDVECRVLGMQDLSDAADLRGRFPALVCIDALENVGPEDWPVVVRGLAAVLRPGGLAYLTVEQPGEDDPVSDGSDPLLRAGELYDGIGYHFYPANEAVLGWLADAGFRVESSAVGDGYWHLLARLTNPESLELR